MQEQSINNPMTKFDAVLAQILLEDPDQTMTPSREVLYWKESQARAFGFVDLSKPQTFRDLDTTATLEGFEGSLKLIATKIPKKMHGNLVDDVLIPELSQAKTGEIKLFHRGDLAGHINFAEPNLPLKIRETMYDLGEMNPRILLNPAGRIWLESRVISFWAEAKEVDRRHLDLIKSFYNIEDFDSVELEFLGDDGPSTTVEKFLKHADRSEPSSEPDPEQSERMAAALRKVHVAAAGGSLDPEAREIINKRKTASAALDATLRTQGKIPSLQTRQQASTSESRLNNSMNRDNILLEQAYEQVIEESMGKTLGALAVAVMGLIGAKSGIEHAEREYSGGLPSLRTPDEHAAKDQLNSYLNKLGLIKTKADPKHIEALKMIASKSPDTAIKERAQYILAHQDRIAHQR
jgi:hypothetical protein